jgi:hypothetical protein
MWKRGLIVFGALLLVEVGLWVWGLWPLSDPRFEWKPYYDELVATRDCQGAVGVVSEAAILRERRAIDFMRQLAVASWCPEAVKFFTPGTIQLFEKVQADRPPWLAWLYPPREGWGPGWGGRWNALPYIFREETRLAAAEAVREHGQIAGVAGLGWWVPRHLRCGFALHVQPESSYARLRHTLSRHGHKELALPDWDKRTERCYR